MTFGVGAARIWVTYVDSINRIRYYYFYWSGRTERERVSAESLSTNTDWNVIGYTAFSVGTTSVNARVFAAVTYTALVP